MDSLITGILKHLHFSHPTSEQKNVLKAMETFIDKEDAHDFLILCGAAGTGKTSITTALIGYLGELNMNYHIAAPTGRAARILGKKSNTLANTIHSLIYIPSTNKESGQVKFTLKDRSDYTPSVYIIDEASMISAKKDSSESLFQSEASLLDDLMAFIKKANPQNKIIFLGDQYQLPPIGELTSLALQKDFLETRYNQKGSSYLLTEVKRQEDGSYILSNATDIRKAIENDVTTHPIQGNQNKDIYSAASKYVNEIKSDGYENSVVIGVSHKANDFFNKLARERMFGHAKQVLETGDLLMVNRNWSRGDSVLYNGDHVVLESVDWNLQEQVAGLHFVAVQIKPLNGDENDIIEDYAIIETIITPGGQLNPRNEQELRKQRFAKNPLLNDSMRPSDDRYLGALHLIYGHAITCNKAQGGEWKKVYINTLGIPNLKWQYTAVTRGIDEIEKI